MDVKVSIPNLLRKVAREDCENSFRTIFNHFYPRLFELAQYYTKNQSLAEDAVSDVFLKVWINRRSLEEVKDIRAYLFIAVKRQSLNYLRRKPSVPFLNVHDQKLSHSIDYRNPENILVSQEMLQAVSKSIQRLPKRCRLVFKLVKEEKIKYREVARLLDISEKTVEMHVGNALKKIRKDLEHLESEPPVVKATIKSAILGALVWLSFI